MEKQREELVKLFGCLHNAVNEKPWNQMKVSGCLLDITTKFDYDDAKVKALEEKLKVAVEALEFYGSWKSYGSSDHPFLERYSAEVMLDSSEFEYIEKDGDIFKQTFGGKRAREALEKIKAK